LRKVPGKWSIRTGGAVLGESGDVLEMIEGDAPPVYYFPRADIAMAFLNAPTRSPIVPTRGTPATFRS